MLCRILLIIIFLSCQAYSAVSQALSFDDLISFHHKSIGEIDDYLQSNKWKYASFDEEPDTSLTNNNITKAGWIFNNSIGSQVSNAIIFTSEGNVEEVHFSTSARLYYDKIKSRVKQLNMTLESSEVIDGDIQSTYFGKSFKAVLITHKPTERYPNFYSIYVFPHHLTVAFMDDGSGGMKKVLVNTLKVTIPRASQDGCLIRDEPVSDGKIAGTLEPNEIVKIIKECSECGDNYYKIESGLLSSFKGTVYVKKECIEYAPLN